MNSLAAKKQALVAESEVYRHALGMEIQNLRLYTARMKKRMNLLNAARPLLSWLPLLSLFMGKKTVRAPEPKPSGLARWWSRAVLGWRVYRTLAPVLNRFDSLKGLGARLKSRAAAGRRQGGDSRHYADS